MSHVNGQKFARKSILKKIFICSGKTFNDINHKNNGAILQLPGLLLNVEKFRGVLSFDKGKKSTMVQIVLN